MTDTSESKKINKTQPVQENVYKYTQQNNQKNFQYQNLFELGYRDLLRQDPFWLDGKTSNELKIIMEKYVKDYQSSYGILPVWYKKSQNGTSDDVDKINTHNFRIEMKIIHNLK